MQSFKKEAKALGFQTMVEFYNCNTAKINDTVYIRDVLENVAKQAGLTVVKTVIHNFSPIGVSGVVVVEESHIAIHTWPEHAYVALDFFTCNKSYKLDAAINWLQEQLEAKSKEVKQILRGENVER